MWGIAWLDTQGSGAMGFIMFNVSLKLVWPFTLIVSHLKKTEIRSRDCWEEGRRGTKP